MSTTDFEHEANNNNNNNNNNAQYHTKQNVKTTCRKRQCKCLSIILIVCNILGLCTIIITKNQILDIIVLQETDNSPALKESQLWFQWKRNQGRDDNHTDSDHYELSTKALRTNQHLSSSSSSSTINQTTALDNAQRIPHLLPTDSIIQNARSAFVIPEYRLVYITIPKVASSEWKRLLMRITGNPKWCTTQNAHDKYENQLKTLADYNLEVATAIMTSPSWTRATFVREPKERLLSAFLDKNIKDQDHYLNHCCVNLPTFKLRTECKDNHQDFNSFLFFITHYPKECVDVHSDLITNKIDEKWWPYIDFIGYQHTLLQDSQRLMKSLISYRDPEDTTTMNYNYNNTITLWDRFGVSGWGSMPGCENRPLSFLEENTSKHAIGTGSHLKEWYTAENEKIAEEYLAKEWQQPKLHFPNVKLYP